MFQVQRSASDTVWPCGGGGGVRNDHLQQRDKTTRDRLRHGRYGQISVVIFIIVDIIAIGIRPLLLH